MANVIFITGGQRSGKSSFAQQKAEELAPGPVYVATARVWDEEFRQRIQRHQHDRGPHWTTIEEEKYLSQPDLTGRVVVLDCVTLWLTNFFVDNDFNTEQSLEQAKAEWKQLIEQDFTLLVVSNEIGMGIIPDKEMTRHFADLQGWMNQFIARTANEVYLMVSGIPVKIK
ncbi:adenosylcobinamide kinase/adenosylcobinamide phosphate guanyltransferase [Prolixibacter bellariivorans]|uniref:Adenosylcobinamide kinase n=1 Tax=Prolixibacter bellariivorans TaxID=314319 RepID=A0A5M4B558_9BACT|nr:bifunctional adenosylcobinamide kinase/adenosylcobinamide-phosphate guanylyltransferase [Prolixibacter bellariivorans]GET35220.1 adenosylcobinamide kinase/adenosylcobinamide phosphate guanyltransferase [Prolixibacter bellariivorans]